MNTHKISILLFIGVAIDFEAGSLKRAQKWD